METIKPTLAEQIELLDRIREKILDKPETFDMTHWHSACGTSHCIAGWAEVLSENKNGNDTQSIGESLLPDFEKLFYGNTLHLRKWFEARAYALEKGQVSQSNDGTWVDNLCNFYNKELSKEEANKQSESNKDCMYCTDCTGCTNCTDCTNCTGCINCAYCVRCTRCTNCVGCADCTDCTYCTDCDHCTDCTYCTRCNRCNDCTVCTDCDGCTSCNRCTNCINCANCTVCSWKASVHETKKAEKQK